jgi:DNA-directed RNA polymerase specialized sigma24 family protein
MEKLAERVPEGCHSEIDRKRYLFGVARNILREWRRRPGVREARLKEEEEPGYSLPPIDLIAKECLELLRQVVQDSLARLSPLDQDILNRSELNPKQTLTLSELAKVKDMRAAAMRQRAHRARRRFRDLLLTSRRIGDLFGCLGMGRTKQ